MTSPVAQAPRDVGAVAEVDRDALLAALVLAPATYARNRFFALFKEPWAAATRARAAQLTTMVHHLSNEDGVGSAAVLDVASHDAGRITLRYRVPAMHLSRTAVLERLELGLLRFALRRRAQGVPVRPLPESLQMTDDDRALVESALAKLSRELPV